MMSMSWSKLVTISFLVCAVSMVTCSSSVADRIANGDFEATPALDSWGVSPSTAAEPFALGGGGTCANIVKEVGRLYQDFALLESETGLTDFQLDFDLAILSGDSGRKFSMQFSKNESSLVESFRVEGANSTFAIYAGSWTWADSGLSLTVSTDTNENNLFDPGETPIFNHMTLIGSNYGKEGENYSLTFILNHDDEHAYTYSASNTGHMDVLNRINFTGNYAAKDFLVDNVVMTATEVPEPSTLALLLAGAVAGWSVIRRRK